MEGKELYTAKEVAILKGYSRQEIIRKIWRGQINAQKIGNQYLIDKHQLEKIKSKV